MSGLELIAFTLYAEEVLVTALSVASRNHTQRSKNSVLPRRVNLNISNIPLDQTMQLAVLSILSLAVMEKRCSYQKSVLDPSVHFQPCCLPFYISSHN